MFAKSMSATALRNAELAKIHIQVKQLGLDDDAYRDLLYTVTKRRSAADLDWQGRKKLLDHLAKLGAKPQRAPRPRNYDTNTYYAKIGALLADMQLPWNYAQAIAERVTGGKRPDAIRRLEWVRDPAHFRAIITALSVEKEKHLHKARGALYNALTARGLTFDWAEQEAARMGRLTRPWPWSECLETLRLIAERLP